MPEQNSGYYARSWALLTKDRGWIKPLLVLGAAMLLPVVGFLGVQGYVLEWARLTAWGVDAAPKQKDVRVAECISSGWRGFLAGAGYVLAVGLINNLIVTWFGNSSIVGLLTAVVSFAGSVAYSLAALRATIYQDIAAGYALERIWEMIRRDSDGFIRVVLVRIATSFVVGLATTLLFVMAIIPMLVGFALNIDAGGVDLIAGNITEPTVRYIFFEFLDQLTRLAPLLTIIGFIGSVGTVFATIISDNAMALWVRQFDVPSWGASSDPLPMAYGLPPAGYDAQRVPYQQQMPYQQDMYQQQVPYQEQAQPTYQQVPYEPTQAPYQQVQEPYQQVQEPYPQEQPSYQPVQEPYQPVQPVELTPLAAIDPVSKNNDVENKMVQTDSQPAQEVQEVVETIDITAISEHHAEESVEETPEEVESVPEPTDAPEESVQSSQEAIQTEPDEETGPVEDQE